MTSGGMVRSVCMDESDLGSSESRLSVPGCSSSPVRCLTERARRRDRKAHCADVKVGFVLSFSHPLIARKIAYSITVPRCCGVRAWEQDRRVQQVLHGQRRWPGSRGSEPSTCDVRAVCTARRPRCSDAHCGRRTRSGSGIHLGYPARHSVHRCTRDRSESKESVRFWLRVARSARSVDRWLWRRHTARSAARAGAPVAAVIARA